MVLKAALISKRIKIDRRPESAARRSSTVAVNNEIYIIAGEIEWMQDLSLSVHLQYKYVNVCFRCVVSGGVHGGHPGGRGALEDVDPDFRSVSYRQKNLQRDQL